MNEELKIIIKAVTDNAKKGINDVNKQLEGLGKNSSAASSKMSGAFKAIGIGAAAAATAVIAIGAAVLRLGTNTLQLNKGLAKLDTAFQAAGSTAQQATETYKNLYRFLGDSDKAVEAAGHLAKITTS